MIQSIVGAAFISALVAALNAVIIPLMWGACGWVLAYLAPEWSSEAIRITTLPLTVEHVPGLFMLVGFILMVFGSVLRAWR